MTSPDTRRADPRRADPRRGQVFTIDLILGLVITTVAVVALTIYAAPPTAPLRADAERTSTLMGPGIPEDWNATDVAIVGFLTDDRFDTAKIALFESLPYGEQRRLLGIDSEFRIRFTAANGTVPLCTTCGLDPVDPDTVLPLRRYGLWNGTIVTMEVLLWR